MYVRIILCFVLFECLCVLPGKLRGQTNGVTLLDSLNRPHGVSGQNTRFSSCWGWVSPDGREYALLGTYTGTSIIDLNVSPIREIAFISGNTAGYCYREMKTYRNYAYIVSEGGRGVQIVDLSKLPDTAILVREFSDTVAGKNIWRSHTVTLADGYLYLNGSLGWSPGGVVIYSLRTDPTNPQYLGQYEPEYIHDSFVRNDTMYAAAINGGGLYVANLANKANPQTIVQVSYIGAGTHNTWASVNGRYAFTTDETTNPSNLKVWDLQNLGPGPPYSPLATYQATPLRKIHNVHGRGYYAYISHYKEGMRVVDVHNPALPAEVGSYDSYPDPDPFPSTTYNGCWAVYPYFPSGRWIGSDMQTGLFLLSFNGLAPRTRSPLLSPTDGDSAGGAGAITFVWRSAADRVEDPHYYKIHIFGAGVDTLLRSNDTSYTQGNLPALQNGGTYRWHVWIADEFTEVSSQDTFQFIFNGNPPVGVTENPRQPVEFALEQNYPNPFNPTTRFDFAIPAFGFVTLKVYDLLASEVAVLMNEQKQPGRYSITWNASGLPSGVYFYHLWVGSETLTRKSILIK